LLRLGRVVQGELSGKGSRESDGGGAEEAAAPVVDLV
jgi:hypothetical protein